jgi:hypothetical protein
VIDWGAPLRPGLTRFPEDVETGSKQFLDDGSGPRQWLPLVGETESAPEHRRRAWIVATNLHAANVASDTFNVVRSSAAVLYESC